MTPSTPTTAKVAFEDAIALLHELHFPSPSVPPPLELRLPAPSESSVTERPATVRPSERSPRPDGGPRTIVRTLASLSDGTCSTRELANEAIDVAAANRSLGAVVELHEESVRAEAATLDAERERGELRGPLHGVPVTVKDVIDVAGLRTRAGSRAYDVLATNDGPGVARLRAAGALILGKVATHEFALGVTTPQCVNPFDRSRIAGGSSGGSAIAVAIGIGLGSLGTDTRASLRVPSALCGVVGFKPTFGRVPTTGIVPLSWTMDHLGPIARTVEDAAIMLNVLAGVELIDVSSTLRLGTTIGVVDEVLANSDPDIASSCEAALSLLETMGCRLVAMKGPDLRDLEVANAIGLLVSRAEAAAYHRSQGTDLELCLPEVRDQLEAGLTISAVDYLDAQRQRAELAKRCTEMMGECDIVATPTISIGAPLLADYERYLLHLSRNAILWSLVGAPALSVPCRKTRGGLPVGLQLAAAPGNEQVLATTGIAFERRNAEGS